MNREEYTIMFRVEDRHWWYVGLRAMLTRMWDLFESGGHIRMLDVGCGTGANLEYFRTRASCYGIDFSFDAVRLCRKRGDLRTAAASATNLPFAENLFDVVISCDVLSHRSIVDKSRPLREMYRVLKPGGIAILNLPAYQWLHSSHDVHVHADRRFSKRESDALLRQAGFDCAFATHWNSLLFPLILPTRLWRKARPLPASDLDGASGEGLSSIFAGVLRIERALMRVVPMPFGLSLMCVARKPQQELHHEATKDTKKSF